MGQINSSEGLLALDHWHWREDFVMINSFQLNSIWRKCLNLELKKIYNYVFTLVTNVLWTYMVQQLGTGLTLLKHIRSVVLNTTVLHHRVAPSTTEYHRVPPSTTENKLGKYMKL